MDAVFGGVLLIVGGLFLSLLLGWGAPGRLRDDLLASGTPPALVARILWLLRWVSPAAISIGLVISLVDLARNW